MAWAYARRGRSDRTQPVVVDKDAQQQFAELGHTIAIDPDEPSEDILIMECNWPSLEAFKSCETQWEMLDTKDGLVFTRMDYAGCDVVLRRRNVEPHVFDDMQAMERAALDVLNEAD